MSKSIDHRNKENWRDAWIDPKIRPLVEAMDRPELGIRTIACCQGHYTGVKPPYVFFDSSVEFAAALNQLLEKAAPNLNYYWSVEASLQSGKKPRVSYSIRTLHLTNYGLCSGPRKFVQFVLLRRLIDQDLKAIHILLLSCLDDAHFPVEAVNPSHLYLIPHTSPGVLSRRFCCPVTGARPHTRS